MSEFLNHPDFFNQPVLLSKNERKHPLLVLREFFDDYRLSELRHICEEIEEICLTTDHPSFSASEQRANFMLYERRLITLFEAAFVLAKAE